ncbi:MAG: BON domain-containing protein [Chthonomonadales bacterium]|nr:BON domain-containing protein [Chthonomonadales bacterium]
MAITIRCALHGAATLLLTACAWPLVGCNPRDAGDLRRDLRSTAEHSREALGNARIAAQVNTVLALRKGVDMSGLHVEASDGVVTVGGHVRDGAEKRRVLETVRNTRGVDRVVDRLRVAK